MIENELAILKKKAQDLDELSKLIRDASKKSLIDIDSMKYGWLIELPLTDDEYKKFVQLSKINDFKQKDE